MEAYEVLCHLNSTSAERFGLESRLQELGIEYKTSIRVRHPPYGGPQEIIKYEVSTKDFETAKQELKEVYRRNNNDLDKINWKIVLVILVFLALLSTSYCRRNHLSSITQQTLFKEIHAGRS